MTTKILSGTYPTGFYLVSPVTLLSITSAGYVEGKGVYTHSAAPNTYTVVNDGKIAGGASGVYLSNGGVVTNGSVSDTTARISGYFAVKMQQYGTVTNFGSIVSTTLGGFGVYCNEPGLVSNGSALDIAAFIEGDVGVLMTSEPSDYGTVRNFGTIQGVAADSVGVQITHNDLFINGAVGDTSATVTGDYGVRVENPAFVANYGSIIGTGVQTSDAGVYFADGGAVTNGALDDTVALIEGYVTGVLSADSIMCDVTNFATIATTGEPSQAGVDLLNGGTVVNGAVGDLAARIAGAAGILAANSAATVTNFGRIVGFAATSPGVGLDHGGLVINGSLQDTVALIAGGRGVDISGAAGTVKNFGTIQGGARPGYFGSTQYTGVNLYAGGILTNGAAADPTALIEGYDGVLLGQASTATNLGMIQATGGYGVHLYDTSTMTNGSAAASHALITGWVGAEVYGSATLTNFATVTGAGGVAAELGAATSRLNAEAGSVFVGDILAGTGLVDFVSGTSTAGGLRSAGGVEGAGTVTLDGGVSTFATGVSLSVAKIIVASAATTVDVTAATLTDAKIWDQTAGILTVLAGDRINFDGIGDTFAGTVSGGGTVGLTGGSDMLSATRLAGKYFIISGATVTLSGAITLAGTISVTTPHLIVAAGGASLTGGGEVSLSNLAANKIVGASAAATLANVDDKIVGAGNLGGGEMLLVNAAAGTIEDDDTTGLVIDTGANTIANAGVIESAGPGGVTIDSAVDNTGRLIAQSATLTLEGAVTGAGYGQIAAGTLDFTTGAALAEHVNFAVGSTGTLELAHSQAYSGAVSGFSLTGKTTLDLVDIAYAAGTTKATYSGTTASGVLTVTDGTHTAKIHLTGAYTASTWALSSDGHGGTDIVDPAKAPAAAAPHAPQPASVFVQAMAGAAAGPGQYSSSHDAGLRDAWGLRPIALSNPRSATA